MVFGDDTAENATQNAIGVPASVGRAGRKNTTAQYLVPLLRNREEMMIKLNLRSALLGSAAAAVGMACWAESAQAQLDEIVVTATKRERSLQDVPVSVSAFSAEALQLSGVTNIESLQTTVPGFSVQTSQSSGSNTSLRLRGVGTTGNNGGFEGAVGIFIDGIYQSRAGAALGDFPDVERIEILRGPQGTLFGKNTTAGAINVITKRPVMDEFDAELRVTFGNFDHQAVRGTVNFPIVEGKLAGRVAADYNRRDGFGVSIFDSTDDINDRDRYNIRGQLLWTPTNDLEVRVIGNYFAANESCCGAVPFNDGLDGSVPGVSAQLASLSALTLAPAVPNPVPPPATIPGATFVGGALLGLGFSLAEAGAIVAQAPGVVQAPVTVRNGNFSTRDFPVSERQENRNIQIDTSWDIFENINFFNTISYQRYDAGGTNDVDFSAADFLHVPFAAGNVELFVEEFRFSGRVDEVPLIVGFDWLFGGYYSSETLGGQALLTHGSDADFFGPIISQNFTNVINTLGIGGLTGAGPSVTTVPGVTVGDIGINEGDSQFTVNGQNARTRALFGHLTIDLLEWLELSGGARFTTEDKTGGGVFTTVNVAGTNPFLTPGLPFEQEADSDEWIGTVALKVDFTDQISAYASFAHGYKAPAINFDQLGGQGGLAATVSPNFAVLAGTLPGVEQDAVLREELNNTYELGLRTQFWNNRATVNVTGFHSVFRNFQILEFTGTSFTILTAPEVTATGVEAEMALSPFDGLNLTGAVTYSDAEYSAPFNLSPSQQLGDSRLTNAPLWSGAVTATYLRPLPNTGLIGLLHGEWAYNSQANTSTGLAPSRLQNGFSLFNGRVGVRSDDDLYEIALWCRNCGDEQYRNIIFGNLLGGESTFITPPREWGVTLTARY